MTQVLNAKGKPFTWSPSAIGDYQTCPRQYGAKRFYVTLPYIESTAMKQGNIEHKHLEDRLRTNKPLQSGYTRGEKYCKVFEASGKVIAEQELAFTRDMKFVSWFSKEAWGRCKIDVTVEKKDNKIGCFDWKTGKIKDASLQLKINACVLAAKDPRIEEFILRYIWLKHDAVTGENFTAQDIPVLWAEILGWLNRMEEAWKTEQFDPKPSGLCRKWCDVKTCEFCGK